jgi:hypothetical protein
MHNNNRPVSMKREVIRRRKRVDPNPFNQEQTSTNNSNSNQDIHPIINLKQCIFNSISDIQISIDLLNILDNNPSNNSNNNNPILLASYANNTLNNNKLLNSDMINILSSNLNAKKQVRSY